MSRRENRAFCFSAAFHIVGLLSFAIVGLLTNCTEEPEVRHVFQLVPPPSASLAKVSPKPAASIVKPKPPVVKPKPKPTVDQPKPKPKPVVKPKPKPQIKVTPPKNKPKPTTKPPPKKPKATISLADFKRTHKRPTVKPKPTLKRPEPRPRVRIDPNVFKIPEIPRANPQIARAAVNPNELNRYLSFVKAQLETVWQRLQAQAGLNAGGEAKVQFRISAGGVILAPAIVRRSGNPTLDKLVLQVCRSVGNVGRPPGGGIDSPIALPFRVNY
jgi:TonB family protein